jgi:cytochrome c553
MADKTTTVTVAPGSLIYKGAGLHPFREGEAVELSAEDAADLAAHVVQPKQAAESEKEKPAAEQPAA